MADSVNRSQSVFSPHLLIRGSTGDNKGRLGCKSLKKKSMNCMGGVGSSGHGKAGEEGKIYGVRVAGRKRNNGGSM